MMNLRFLLFVFCAFFAFTAMHGRALAAPKNISKAERALLPDYCNYVRDAEGWNKESGNGKYWQTKFGDDLGALHHYCWAHLHWNRTTKPGLKKPEVDFEYTQVIAEIGYCLRSTSPNFMLRPEFYHRSGQAAMRIKQYIEAQKFFEQAIKEKNDYWPSYVELADVYLLQGNANSAKQVLQLGEPFLPTDNPRVTKLKKELKL